MPISDKFILKELAGDFMIIPLSSTGVDATKIFNINETGALIYRGLKNNKSFDEIAEEMCKVYDINKESALKDVIMFRNKLKEKGIYYD